jgi:hypothetical protein
VEKKKEATRWKLKNTIRARGDLYVLRSLNQFWSAETIDQAKEYKIQISYVLMCCTLSLGFLRTVVVMCWPA